MNVLFKSIVVASFLLASLVGCSSPVSSNQPPHEADQSGIEVLAKGEIAEEYRAAVEAFPEPLPDGYSYLAALGPEYEPADGKMEKGSGEVAVAFTWLCAWEDSYIKSFDSGDTERADDAVTMIGKWKFLPKTALYVSDPEDSWTRAVLEPAQRGDPTGIRGDFSALCGGFGFEGIK